MLNIREWSKLKINWINRITHEEAEEAEATGLQLGDTNGEDPEMGSWGRW